MLVRTVQVGGYWFTFRIQPGPRRLIHVDSKNAYQDYWTALTGALGLLFGVNKG